MKASVTDLKAWREARALQCSSEDGRRTAAGRARLKLAPVEGHA
jgi:hypothetical protein